MATPLLLLIHSPLVGPLTWMGCSAALRARGYATLVPSLAGVFEERPPWLPKLAARIAGAIHERGSSNDMVLVVHSGAGSLVPASVQAIGPRARAIVFVDAVLPHPGQRWMDTAPPELRQRLIKLCRDGRLPPWNEWFPADSIASHLPDESLRARFIAELPRLPLTYFEERAPEAREWESIGCGYIQLSGAYHDALCEAAARGWPTRTEPLDHLAMVTRPEAIASSLVNLLEAMGVRHERFEIP